MNHHPGPLEQAILKAPSIQKNFIIINTLNCSWKLTATQWSDQKSSVTLLNQFLAYPNYSSSKGNIRC